MEIAPPRNVEDAPRATRKDWIGLAVLALPCLLYAMDLTVLNLAVPHLSAELKPSSTELLWIIDIYGFVLAGALIPMGVLGDRIGRRKLLLMGASCFGVTSLLAAFADSVPLLIAARALLGLSAATLAPSTLSLIRNMFLNDKERTFAIGIWVSSFSAGGAVGPVLGGILLEYFWWGSVFLLNVPIMALLLLIGPRLLPEFKDPTARRPDILSGFLSVGTVLGVIFGIKRLAQSGFSDLFEMAVATIAILVGLGFAACFVHRQRRLEIPFIDLALFSNSAFSAALGINIVAVFAAFGSFLFIAQFLQLIIGLSPLEAGLYSAPSGLAFVVGSMVTPQLLKLSRPAYVMATGLLLTGMSFIFLAQIGTTSSAIPLVVGIFIMFSLGLSPVFTLTTDFVIGAVPPERAGVASGMAETSAEFGGALGIAVLGSVVTIVYRHVIATTLPADIPIDAALAARDTLSGALTSAGALPQSQSETLIAFAKLAYMDAFHIISFTCAVLVLTAAIVAAWVLKRVDQRHAAH